MKFAVSTLCMTFLFLPSGYTTTFDWEASKVADHEMAFRLYIPDEVKSVRALLVLTPGYKADGRKMVDDKTWKDFAQKHQCALLACSMRGEEGGKYYEVEKWGGAIFLEAINNLAKESQHPEIEDAPIALWGFSAGGQFNFNFACWKPERTLAFVANKGGYYGSGAGPQVRLVPGLWILGAKDKEFRVQNISTLYGDNRKLGALWALVTEPNAGHQVARSSEIGRAFIEEVLTSRLDASGSIKPSKPESGWLGDHATRQISKNPTAEPGPATSSWFPGEKTARLWKDIVSEHVVASPKDHAPTIPSEN